MYLSEILRTEVVVALTIGFIGVGFSVFQRLVHKKLDKIDNMYVETPQSTFSDSSTATSTRCITLQVSGQNNDVRVVHGECATNTIKVSGLNNDRTVRIPRNARIKLKISGMNNDVVFDRLFYPNIIDEQISGMNNDVEYK